MYKSVFLPSASAVRLLRSGRIISESENPRQMVERVVETIISPEVSFGTKRVETLAFEQALGELIDKKIIVFSTPILTNAGRYPSKPLSACAMPDMKPNRLLRTKVLVNSLHRFGMGTGFNFSKLTNPVRMLMYLNRLAVDGSRSGKEDRPVGNIAILSVYHPMIMDFIQVKNLPSNKNNTWKFNISIDIDDNFMQSYYNDSSITLQNGNLIKAKRILSEIAVAAHGCGDPGIISMERIKADNPTPGLSNYETIAPCAEVGLSPGEVCQFGYLNLSKFVSGKKFNYPKIEQATQILTRSLDNAVEINLSALPRSRRIMKMRRKIGIGVCGLADSLAKLEIPYDSVRGRKFACDIISLINYSSKLYSHKLAKTRGSFQGFTLGNGCLYNLENGIIENKYIQNPTATVSARMWRDLANNIRETKLLRNSTTTALPPTGRSSQIVDASAGIEPYFSIQENSQVYRRLMKILRPKYSYLATKIKADNKIGHLCEIPLEIRMVYKTAVEINPKAHIHMAASIQRLIDESISKTINLPEQTSPDSIEQFFVFGYKAGLKSITIYRANSKQKQPLDLPT